MRDELTEKAIKLAEAVDDWDGPGRPHTGSCKVGKFLDPPDCDACRALDAFYFALQAYRKIKNKPVCQKCGPTGQICSIHGPADQRKTCNWQCTPFTNCCDKKI